MARLSARRMGRILGAYLLAAGGAGTLAALAFLPVFSPFAFYVLALAIPITIVTALLPAFVLIAWAERDAVRSLRTHLLFGAAIGIVMGGLVLLGPMEMLRVGALLPLLGLALAGSFGGWIYHRFAGRNAGA